MSSQHLPMIDFDQAELARALFTELGDALFLLDPETDQLVEVNPVAERITGFPRAELLRLRATYLFRYDAPGGMQRLKGAFAKTMAFHGQDGFLLRTREEDWVPVSLTVSRLHVAPKTMGLIIARDDRERRAALAQARRVEAELRTVLGSSPSAHWSAERAPGPDVFAGWQFRYVSPLLARIAGRPQAYIDHPFKWADVVHPSDREQYRGAFRAALTGETDREQHYRVQTADGATRWVRDRLQVVRDESGRPVRLDGCVTDVTEHRRAEEGLRQSEARFRALVEKSRDGILLVDDRGTVRYATAAAKLILGYEPEEMVGRDALSFVHPDDLAVAREALAQTLARPGEDVPAAFRAGAADGGWRHIEANAVNRLSDPAVRAIVANYRDVTERETAARELSDQYALLEGLFASVPDILVYKDREGRFLGCNPAFEALSGRPAADALGRTCDELFTAEWAVRLRAAEQEVLKSGQTIRCKEWVGYPDGRKALLDIALAPLRDAAAETTGLIIVGRDVTEQERLEDELRQSHKLEALGRLAGGIAHDFNNLLTVVLGNLELVRCGAATGSDADEMLAATERAAKQAAELTKQILGFSRRQPIRTATVDLNALVGDSLGLVRRAIDPAVEVRFAPAADLPAIVADPVQVQQIVMNLCLNARDAMPHGGVLALETAADTPAFVRLSVADTGVGMTDEVRSKIFDPFFTTKGVGQGTGLGLAVVYGVAKAHGGRVEVVSTPGAGSRFDVYLPCGPAAPVPDRKPEPRRPAETVVSASGGATVLLADDDDAVRELAKTALERAGYRVLLARDGVEAVDAFRANAGSVRLLVLDIGMPRMSGRHALEAIRKQDASAPAIFASGCSEDVVLAGGGPPGVRVLSKPYTPSGLLAAVHEVLARTADRDPRQGERRG